eukprot:scaffold11710_cov183-Skeletonema_marinoi.AAC.2
MESKSPKIMCTRKWSSSPIKAGKHDLTAESRTPKSPKMIFNARALRSMFSAIGHPSECGIWGIRRSTLMLLRLFE